MEGKNASDWLALDRPPIGSFRWVERSSSLANKKKKEKKEKEFRFFSFSLARSRKWIDRPEASVSVKVSRRFDVSDVATPPFFFRLLDVAGSTNRRASSSIRNGGYRSELLRAKKKEIGGKKTKKKRRRRRRRRGSHSNATVSFSGHFTGFYLVFLHVIDCMGSHRVACCIYRFWLVSVSFSSITHVFTGFYWVLLGFTGFFVVVLDPTKLHDVFMGLNWFQWVFARLNWVLLSFTGFYWVLLGFSLLYWTLQSFMLYSWVIIGSSKFLLDLIRFYWVLLGFRCCNGSLWMYVGFIHFFNVFLLGFPLFFFAKLNLYFQFVSMTLEDGPDSISLFFSNGFRRISLLWLWCRRLERKIHFFFARVSHSIVSETSPVATSPRFHWRWPARGWGWGWGLAKRGVATARRGGAIVYRVPSNGVLD